MGERPLRFALLKECVEKKKINIDLDRRKSIEYYNKHIANGQVTLTRPLRFLYHLSRLAGYGLLVGIFMIFFMKPWYYGLIVCLISIYMRYQVWKYLKNRALTYTREQALQSEPTFNSLYKTKVITLKDIETGRTTCFPEKWTVVLPKNMAGFNEI